MTSRRTEAPTPRRLRRARDRGEIPSSRELTGAAALVGGLAALSATAPASVALLARAVGSGIRRALDPAASPSAALADAALLLARTALPPLLGAAAGALVAGSLQARGLFALSAARFRWERIDPVRGLARFASVRRLVALATSTAKAAAILVTGWIALRAAAPRLTRAPQLGPDGMLRVAGAFAAEVAWPLAAVLVAFGAVDLGLAVRRHHAALRMTREEVRREQREDQGDPARKAERRRRHRALATAPPLRRAACVVVNPTHFAVALHHDRAGDDAPTVVAKARGRAAAALRSEARRAGVPIVRDVALARALFRLAEIGDEIPPELYEAAAVVLAHLYGRPEEWA